MLTLSYILHVNIINMDTISFLYIYINNSIQYNYNLYITVSLVIQ